MGPVLERAPATVGVVVDGDGVVGEGEDEDEDEDEDVVGVVATVGVVVEDVVGVVEDVVGVVVGEAALAGPPDSECPFEARG